MLSWLRRRFSPSLVPPPAELEEPDWVDDLLSAVQKQTRAAAKQSARLEEAIGELSEQVEALRDQVKAGPAVGAPTPGTQPTQAIRPDELFDAVDALDEALQLVRDRHLAEGLSRVRDRLLGFCARQGYTLLGARGDWPDGRFVRVVGTEVSPGAARGTITRVVRAAVLEGERLIREGEVIVCMEDGREQRVGD